MVTLCKPVDYLYCTMVDIDLMVRRAEPGRSLALCTRTLRAAVMIMAVAAAQSHCTVLTGTCTPDRQPLGTVSPVYEWIYDRKRHGRVDLSRSVYAQRYVVPGLNQRAD